MAALGKADPRRMYSWWWDSHISPKNSKWLQENLTDMDAKVKAMIKLIEEDADSFARRAEMYYKKRPELMKMVEEFYRAYRALAERYDHATGVIRQAHRTMTEAFPNQLPLLLVDESPPSATFAADPQTPKVSTPARALFESDALQKDESGLLSSHGSDVKKNGEFTEDSNSMTRRKGSKQFNDLFGSEDDVKLAAGRVRKGLNFHNVREAEDVYSPETFKTQTHSDSEQAGESDEILSLKKALSQVEAERQADFVQYQKSLEKLHELESEISRAQENSKELADRAIKAEAAAQGFEELLSKLEGEKEASLLQYQQCLDRIANLDNILARTKEDAEDLNDRACKAETEAQALREDVTKVRIEKDAAIDQYMQSLRMITKLENKLLLAGEESKKFKEQAESAESEIENLKKAVSKLTEEKDAAALHYQQSSETISTLEHKLASAQDEAQRLNAEIDSGVAKLKGAQEQCLLLERTNQSLHSELENLMLKMGTQSQELTEKQQEIGKLWTCIQEERLRFVEAETAFQTLQHLHSQAQEELRSLASELQNRVHVLREVEANNQSLQDEVSKVKEENKSLSDLNESSAVSIKGLQNEISGLRETKGKLEQEVELRLDQRNALQQEIYCLRKELNDLNKKHESILEQVNAVGFDPKCFESSVKQLQAENSSLRLVSEKEHNEKVALLEKLQILEQLLEKNTILENSISDLNDELEAARWKIKALEESCRSLFEEKSSALDEKATLITQLQVMNENLEKLSAKNSVLENSLSDVRDELQAFKAKSKSLEESFQLLVEEKASLAIEKDDLLAQLQSTQLKLEDLEKIHVQLKERHSTLEEEKDSTLCKMEEIRDSLITEKKNHERFVQMSGCEIAGLKDDMLLLQKQCQKRTEELDKELDKALESQIEIFILQSCAQELNIEKCTESIKYRELLEAFTLSKNIISGLEEKNLEHETEVKSLSLQASILREGIHQLLTALGIVAGNVCQNNINQDKIYLDQIFCKLRDAKISLCKSEEVNQQLAVELSVLITLLRSLQLEADDLVKEKSIIYQELKMQSLQITVLQDEAIKLNHVTELLRLKLKEKDEKEEALVRQVDDVQEKVSNVEGAFQELLLENTRTLAEKRSLTKEFLLLEERRCMLEEEICTICNEMFYLGNLSLVLKSCMNEMVVQLKRYDENLNNLRRVNSGITSRLEISEQKLKEVQTENLNLKEMLQKSEQELKTVCCVRDQLTRDIVVKTSLLCESEKKVHEAETRFTLVQTEVTELHNLVESLRKENIDFTGLIDQQRKLICELSASNDEKAAQNNHLQETKQCLQAELLRLSDEEERRKTEGEALHFELQKKAEEINMWETEALALFGDVQLSCFREVFYQQKVHEIVVICDGLKCELDSKGIEIDQLKEKMSGIFGENTVLKGQLMAYAAAIVSLSEFVSSLEKHTFMSRRLTKSESQRLEAAELAAELAAAVDECHENEDGKTPMVSDASSDLQDLQRRAEYVEKALVQMKQLLVEENLDMHSKLQAAIKEIDELKLDSCDHRRHSKPTSEISESNVGLLTKDIMLDSVSDGSSEIGRRENDKASHQVSKLSQIDSADGTKVATLPTEENIEFNRIRSVRKHRRDHPSSDALIEKELGVDKLQISRRYSDPVDVGSKRKVLERLNSDVQKLMNLQITVQDLRGKLDMTRKSKKGKGMDQYETLKEQLEETEEAIQKLFDLNGQLVKGTQNSISISDPQFSMEVEEDGSVRRRRISEQARKISERIGRLQLEVQKIQFVLVRLDDEKENKGKSKLSEMKRRVLLRDYLYGGVRKSQKRKKAPFCACVQSPTTGD